jgi:hypothetical protein
MILRKPAAVASYTRDELQRKRKTGPVGMLTVKPAVCPCDKHVTKGLGLFGEARDCCHCRASQAVPLTSSSKDILVAESGDEC